MWNMVLRCLTLIAGLTFFCLVEIAPGQEQQTPAQLQLTVERPGLTSLELESQIALPLETVVKPLPDIQRCEAELRDDECKLVLTLEQGASPQKVMTQLQSAMTGLVAFDLKPEDVLLEQLYSERDAVWVVCKSPELGHESIIESANDLQSKLERIPHIGKVTAFGIPRRVIEIAVDNDKSRAYQLSAQSIYEAIRKHISRERPGSKPETPANRTTVSLNELSESLPVLDLDQANGVATHLQDVANVNTALFFQSDARLGRDRVMAFEVRSMKVDARKLQSDIESNQADWLKALRTANEGMELAVLRPQLKVELVLPSNATNTQFERIAELAESRIREQSTIPVDLLSVRTSPDSNLLRLYLGSSGADAPNRISSQSVRESLAELPGILVQITDYQKKADDSIELRIFGPDLDVLRKTAQQASVLLHRVNGVVEVKSDSDTFQSEMSIEVKRERTAQLGIKMNDITTSIGLMLSPDGPEDLLEAGVRLRFQERPVNSESLGEMMIPAGNGQLIPLSAVADVQLRMSPPVVKRSNGSRMVKLVVQPTSKNERPRIVKEVRQMGEKLRPEVAGENYWIEVE